MAAYSRDQGQDLCRILVLTAENTNAQCGWQLNGQTCMDDVSVNRQKSAEFEKQTSHSFNASPPPLVHLDIEKGASGFPKTDHKTATSIKVEIPSIMKLLRRQNSLPKGGEFISPLMNHILMLLKFDPKGSNCIFASMFSSIVSLQRRLFQGSVSLACKVGFQLLRKVYRKRNGITVSLMHDIRLLSVNYASVNLHVVTITAFLTEKQVIERVHDAATNKWRKYKRAASFDSRQIVMLFSILSSMGTIVLIFLTLRVRLSQ